MAVKAIIFTDGHVVQGHELNQSAAALFGMSDAYKPVQSEL